MQSKSIWQVWSRNEKKCEPKICKFTYHIFTPRDHWKFQRGGPVLKAKIFKQEYEAKLEFPEGVSRVFKPKNHPWGATWIFSGMIHCKHFDMFSATNYKTVATKSGSSHFNILMIRSTVQPQIFG